MMQHSTTLYRSLLRNQLVSILQEAQLVPEGHIFKNFPIKVPQDRLPCCFVSSPSDRAEPLTVGTPVFMRTATLVIQYFCSFVDIDKASDQIDAICYKIENAILCDHDFQQMVEQIPSFDTDIVFNGDIGKQIAEIRLVMPCKYREEFYPQGVMLDHITGQTI